MYSGDAYTNTHVIYGSERVAYGCDMLHECVYVLHAHATRVPHNDMYINRLLRALTWLSRYVGHIIHGSMLHRRSHAWVAEHILNRTSRIEVQPLTI